MDSWEIFDENTIPSKEAFYSKFNLENITDRGYDYVKKVWETFEITNLGEYHDLYYQCDTFLLADVTLEISVLKYINLILPIFCLR